MSIRYDIRIIDEIDPEYEMVLREDPPNVQLTLTGVDEIFELSAATCIELSTALKILAERLKK